MRYKYYGEKKYYGDSTEFSTPYQYLANKFKTDCFPNYIIRFFEELHENHIMGKKQEVKAIRENEVIFCEKLNSKLVIACDSYMGIKTVMDVDEDF